MSNQTQNELNLLDIGYGLKIGLKELTWQVWGKSGCFDLIETGDFYRVVTLLEHPYSKVESVLNKYAQEVSAANLFPLWRVVGAGLAFQSDQWAILALTWFPHLGQNEKVMLGGLLEDVAHSKWASQKSRQLASRYAKEIRAINN